MDSGLGASYSGPRNGAVYVFVKPAGVWSDATQTAKLLASDGEAGDALGWSLAVQDDVILASAYTDNDNGIDSGSAYVFVKPAGAWVDGTETAKLKASDGYGSDIFGKSAALDGDTIVIGAYRDDDSGVDSGSAYVFTKPVGGWVNATETAKLKASDGRTNDHFGTQVSLHKDFITVGAPRDDDNGYKSGSVYIFAKPVGGWVDAAEDIKVSAHNGGAGDLFGDALAQDGEYLVVAAHDAERDGYARTGSAYVFGIQDWTDIPGSGAATTSHTVSGLTNGVAYTFGIRAANGVGNSEATESVGAIPAGPPLAPTGFNATGGDMSVILTWEAADANGSPITKYQYQQKQNDGSFGSWTDISDSAPGGTNAVSYTVTSLTNGIVYTSRLRAVNDVGEGAESDERTVTLPAAKPTGLTATAGHRQVTLAWGDPSDTTITGYQYRQTTATTTDGVNIVGDFSLSFWGEIPGANAGTTSHTVQGLTSGNTYYFQVRAGNPSGPGGATMYSAASDQVSATALLGPPNAPETLTAVPGNGVVDLSWVNPDDPTIFRYEYRQADSYQYRETDGVQVAYPVWPTDTTDSSELWTAIPGSGAGTTAHTVAGLDNDRTIPDSEGDADDVLYTFQVRAVNHAIDGTTEQLGAASVAVKASPGLPLSIPTGFEASWDPQTGAIALVWDEHPYSSFVQFEYRWTTGIETGSAQVDATQFEAATTGQIDVGAAFGTYQITLRARFSFGPWSDWSGPVRVETSPFLDQPGATREVDQKAGDGSSVGKPVEVRIPGGYGVRLSITVRNGDFAIDPATGQITVTGDSRAPGAYPVAVTATVTETLSSGTSARTHRINLTINVTSRGRWMDKGNLTAFDGAAGDSLGYAVAVDESSGTIVVGAKDHNGRVGAVYVYDGFEDDTPAKLTPPTTNAGEQFGYAVAIKGDTIVVGSTEADTTTSSGFPPTAVRTRQGTVYVFTKATDADWADSNTLTAALTSDDSALFDGFGESVAISGDTIVVGARYRTPDALGFAGAAYVFVKADTGWTDGTQTVRLEAPIPAAGEAFGTSVANDGNHVVIGAPGQGKVYVFTMPGDGWADTDAPAAALTGPADSLFGSSVSIESGNIAIGAPTAGTGAVYVYSGSGRSWRQSAKLSGLGVDDSDGFGISVAISGDSIAAGRYNQADNDLAGSVQVFEKTRDRWTSSIVPYVLTGQQGMPDDQFGASVALAGNILIVGATGVGDTGAAYVLEQTMSQRQTGPGQTDNTGSQAAMEVPPGVPTTVETPNGDLVLEIEATNPIQVRLNADVAGCQSPVTGGTIQSCVSVKIVASDGGSATGAVRSAELSIAVVGTGERIGLYKRADAAAPWDRIPSCEDSPASECFTIAQNGGGGTTVTVRNIASFSQYVVVQLPASVTTGDGTATVVRRRRGRATPTPTPTPTVIVATPAPTQAAVQPTDAPQSTPMAPTAAPTPVSPTTESPTPVPPTPEPTPVAAVGASPTPTPADTPAPIAALPGTPAAGPTTGAVPPAVVEQAGGFPAWLIAAVVAAVLIAGGLGFGAWRLLRPQ